MLYKGKRKLINIKRFIWLTGYFSYFFSYEDVLEIPLQPLYDNLDCYTYEIFEKDPVKYKLYQNAIEAALKDRVTEEEIDTKLVS